MIRDVKRWLWLGAILALAVGVTGGFMRWQSLGPEQRFMRIKNGMTLGEVRAIMGREEDDPKTPEERAADPDYETRMWRAPNAILLVGFDTNGFVLGKTILYHPKLGKGGYHDGACLPPSKWDGPPGR